MRFTFLALVFILGASCAHHYEPAALYSADTAKQYKCEPTYIDKSILPTIFDKKHENGTDWSKHEQTSGYSDCIHENNGIDFAMTECKKPIPHKHMTTTKQALCHKFMVDNKLMENTTK
jgi:hypothetical protein